MTLTLSVRLRLQHLAVTVADGDDDYDNFTECIYCVTASRRVELI